MSGVGITLRKRARRGSLSTELSAYAYAGMISAGPLILSITGILLIGILSLPEMAHPEQLVQFQVSATYLTALSLIATGPFQLSFTRFISDRLYKRQFSRVLSNFNGVTLVATVVTGLLGVVAMLTVFKDESLMYRVLMLLGFVTLSNIWIGVTFLTSVKQYHAVFLFFFVGYVVAVTLAIRLNGYGLEGLLAGFVIGHVIILLALISLVNYKFRSDRYISMDVFDRRAFYVSLALIGFLFNLGVWLDKFVFWYSATGQKVIGSLHASVIYDIPIFIAYLCIIPGMAVLFYRLETSFVGDQRQFFDAVRFGGTLQEIRYAHDAMVRSARAALYEVLKVQTIVVLLIFAFGGKLLGLLGISVLYLPLLHIDVIGVSLQILFLGILNIFFYIDRRNSVLSLTALFVVLNGSLTWFTLQVGPNLYGYGFAGSLLIVVLIAMYMLNRSFGLLEYQTYMLQSNS
ncbi:exopolysaccharide Pel transporter PelG [Pusillimonas sp. ANT_WB101]|uniref:exopolysaccharide Pel transporter PelG n=1 Tax=Pusillimonas sp. ANT_WB101 TaxID=2597356 RepID=UPI0011EDE3CE|nr:exopolysaccharide Pel transporter PelG [Pusillimonas sp. ANT_WB101]KAA0911096.1 histidine kinase [Pusillimonas sp. ANT_WB101]